MEYRCQSFEAHVCTLTTLSLSKVLVKHKETLALDFACVIVEHIPTGVQEVAFSQGRPYPLDTVQQMLRSGVEPAQIGVFCKDYYRQSQLPVTREEQIQGALAMALVQLSNRPAVV